MRHFARANVSILPPGPWKELTPSQWDSVTKWAKVKDKLCFTKAGVEGLSIPDTIDIKSYENIYPELYELLKEE